MGIFGNMACKMGIHKWSDWKYKDEHDCCQVRSCSRCYKQEQQILHAWKQWKYEREFSCQLERICPRCHAKESGEVKHSWHEWQYEAEHSCQLERVCSRCDAKEIGNVKHCWTEWQYATLTLNMEVSIEKRYFQKNRQLDRECIEISQKLRPLKRMLTTETDAKNQSRLQEQIKSLNIKLQQVQEEGNRWNVRLQRLKDQRLSCQEFRKCSRCGEQEIKDGLSHQWGEKEFESFTSCRIVQYCQRCGELQDCKEERHQWGQWLIQAEDRRQVKYCERCGKKELGGYYYEDVEDDADEDFEDEIDWSSVSPEARRHIERMQSRNKR